MLRSYDVPVAFSMIALANASGNNRQPEMHPIQQYVCYWTAFNNIYSRFSEQKISKKVKRDANGQVVEEKNGSVSIPQVKRTLTERDEIDLIFGEFSEDLKGQLIKHDSTGFFAYRTPKWKGRPISSYAGTQRVNGVLNIKKTINTKFPVWSPIDLPAYQRYLLGQSENDDINLLSRQVLFLLYTVRNNSVHGGKRADDASDREVLEKALPLLQMIVWHFVESEEFQVIR